MKATLGNVNIYAIMQWFWGRHLEVLRQLSIF